MSIARNDGRDALRTRFRLPPDVLYLNHASVGPTPDSVLATLIETAESLARDPIEAYGRVQKLAEAARRKVADFVGSTDDELSLTRSTTDGMRSLAEAFALRPGDRILTTDQEHPGGLAGWEHAARRSGAGIDKVVLPRHPVGADEILSLVEKGLAPSTRVLSVSHVTFVTGIRMPIADIARLARERGVWLVVDGAQAPGLIGLDLEHLGCHAYAGSGHKAMLGPVGTGFLFLSRPARKAFDIARLSEGPGGYTGVTGLQPLPAIVALGSAVDFLTGVGMKRIEERALSLREKFRERLTEVVGLRSASPSLTSGLASPLLTLDLPDGVDSVALQRKLVDKYKIHVKSIPGRIRVAPHLYTLDGDIATLATALEVELKDLS